MNILEKKFQYISVSIWLNTDILRFYLKKKEGKNHYKLYILHEMNWDVLIIHDFCYIVLPGPHKDDTETKQKQNTIPIFFSLKK